MTPRLTIGVPVFNGARYLGETLDSLLAQSSRDFVVVVSDNGSTDETPAICERYARSDPRITVHRHAENRGAAWNYNHLVDLAATPFFKWSGSDDKYAPTYVERCLEAIDRHGGPVLVYPRTVLIDADGTAIRAYDDGLDLRSPDPTERFDRALRYLGLTNPVFGVVRTAALRATPRIAPYNDSDVVLLLELCLRGAFEELPEPLFFRRMHAEQAYEANRTPRDVRRWFDPSASTRVVSPRARRFFEVGRAVARVPLSTRQRLACAELLVRRWAARDLYHSARELLAELGSRTTSRRVTTA